jgi:hypothetical protein
MAPLTEIRTTRIVEHGRFYPVRHAGAHGEISGRAGVRGVFIVFGRS